MDSPNTPIACWILAPSDQEGSSATPMYPQAGHLRPEFRGVAGRANTIRQDGYVEMPGDDLASSPDMLALERATAQQYFHRVALSMRVANGEAPTQGRFSNGLQDPEAIVRALRQTHGFGVPLVDVETPLTRFARWIKPDVHRSSLRAGDLELTRRILALLREARQAGGRTVLFLPQTVEEPTIEPFG